MRYMLLVLSVGGVAAAAALAACTDDEGTAGAGGSKGSGSSVSSSSSSSGVCCCPTESVCNVVKSDCIALVDNKGKPNFALRMAQLDLSKPKGLTIPLIKGIIALGVEMNLAKCYLDGDGTFNLIMAFDTGQKTITVGGAHPAMDPTKGYTFVNEVTQGIQIAPVTAPVMIDPTGKFTLAGGGIDVVLPIYLDLTDAAPSVLLPLHKATIKGTLSADQNCIGKYNTDTLDPKLGCTGDDTTPAFTTEADLTGFMTLEEADKVIVSTVGLSLCVLLTGDQATYGDGMTPSKCKRDAAMKIIYKGDFCQATNMAADASCFDAASLAGKLAASAVTGG